jgi:hypothetical protein
MRQRWILALAILLSSMPVQGQAAVADIAIEVVKVPAGNTPPGSTGTLTLTITNHGPDTAGAIEPGEYNVLMEGPNIPYSLEYGAAVLYGNPIPQDPLCLVNGIIQDPLPGDENSITWVINTIELAPGESRVCEVLFQINPLHTTNVVQPWAGFSAGDEDPDFDNNITRVDYIIATSIPTLASGGLAIFAIALLLAFVGLRRRRGLSAGRTTQVSPG